MPFYLYFRAGALHPCIVQDTFFFKEKQYFFYLFAGFQRFFVKKSA